MALHPTFGAILSDAVNANLTGAKASERADAAKNHPCEPDHSRPGIFAYHNCWRCEHGAKPCVSRSSGVCEYPRARND